MDTLVGPLQEKMEEWKKTVVQLDKDHAKGKSVTTIYMVQLDKDHAKGKSVTTTYLVQHDMAHA